MVGVLLGHLYGVMVKYIVNGAVTEFETEDDALTWDSEMILHYAQLLANVS